MNRNQRISFMVGVGLLLTILIGINARQTILRLIEMNNWEVHTYRVLSKTQRVEALLTSMDNDLRGYLLSNNPYFKADFAHSSGLMSQQLTDIQTLTVDNPVQYKRLAVLNTIFRTKLARSVSLFGPGIIPKGMARLDSIEHFLALSRRFHQVLKETEKSESQLLESRIAASKRSASYALLSNLVGASAALCMILWAIYLLYDALKKSNQLNRKLADSEQLTKRLLEAVPVSVVIVDRYGKFYYANQAATKLIKNITEFDSYADFVGDAQFYRYPDGTVYPVEQRPTYRALQGEPTEVDDLEMRLNGQAVQLLSSSSPVYDAEGAIQYVITTSIDISDRVKSHQRLEETKKMAEDAAKVKEDFLANMSHEIRTPLNAVLGFSELVDATRLDNEQKEYIGLIRTAGKNLLTIVNDILDISKIEAGKIKLESIPFSIQLLAASIQSMCEASAAEKGLQLRVAVSTSLPTVFLGDPTRLTQILLNLLNNAIKFTKKGYVSLQVEPGEATATNVQRVRFTVDDTGIGIAADKLSAIFERFQQAENFTTRYYGGTGLGLNIVKALTELQQGSVSVTSTEGKGSRFVIEIPYAIANEQIRVSQQPVSTAPVKQENVRVLVVEDNLMNQRLVLQVLKRLGYQAHVAENGQLALKLLQEETVDIILMDLQMPVMGGYETTRYIRTKLKLTVPIIAMTAHALPSEKEDCLKAGMNDFLSKPFQIEDLKQVIHPFLPNRKPEAPPASPVTAVAPPAPNFSLTSILELVDNQMPLAIELIELFLSETPPTLDKLRRALEEGDLAEIKRIVHMQKVHTKMLAMDEATRLILEIETLIGARKGMSDVAGLVEQYLTEMNAVLPHLRQYVADNANLVKE